MNDVVAGKTKDLFEALEPEPRLLMGPGPVDVYPAVLLGNDHHSVTAAVR